MFVALISIVYLIDLLLFVWVFLVLCSRRARTRAIVTVVLLAATAYLARIAFVVFVPSRFS